MCETVKLPGVGVAIICGGRGAHQKPHEGTKPAARVKLPQGWPATLQEAQSRGYTFTGEEKICSCGTRILWFRTPAGKWMPVSALKDSRLVPHHAVCERVKEFRRANKRHEARAAASAPKARQQSLF